MAIGITVVVSMLLLLVGHWFPWSLLIGRPLPRLAAYVYGLLSIVIPLTCLLWHWAYVGDGSMVLVLVALWADIICSGLAVVIAYAVDRLLENEQLIQAARREVEVLKRGLHGANS